MLQKCSALFIYIYIYIYCETLDILRCQRFNAQVVFFRVFRNEKHWRLAELEEPKHTERNALEESAWC